MKWPAQLTLIRHAESTYNALKLHMRRDADYQQFIQLFRDNPANPSTRHLAQQLSQRYPALGDIDTPLAEGAEEHAQMVGEQLRDMIELPDVIYVSPYHRTLQTLEALGRGWTELGRVRTIEEERIREQEFGLRLLYSDWRFFFSLQSEQLKLRQLAGPYWYRYPQGENVPDVRSRNRQWATTLARDFAGKHVLAVTHHLSILAFRANMERLSAADFLRLDHRHKPQNCSITIYRGDPAQGQEGRLMLEKYNQMAGE